MDYERENAKEWNFNPASGLNPGTADSDASDDDYEDYDGPLIPVDTNEIQDAESSWKEVSYKKLPSKSTPKPAPKPTPRPTPKLPGNAPFGSKAPATIRNPPAKLPAKPPPKHTVRVPATHPTRFPAIQPARFPATHPATPSPPTLQLTVQPTVQPTLQHTVQPTLQHTLPPTAPNRSRVPPPPPQRRVFTFAHKNDNPARAAFRAQQAATSKFVLSKQCYAIEPDRFKMYDKLEEMGVRLGSFIRPPQSATDRDLLLWGNEDQVNATIQELQMWVMQSNVPSKTTKGGTPFAKTGLLSQNKAKELDRAMKRDAIKRGYQKAPDSSLTFNFKGYFLWPVDEIRPEDLLGPSYEAFDKLRIDFDSYIVFDSQLSAFKILTNQENVVQGVMDRIEGTMKEFVARNSREIVVHMVERPGPQQMRSKVVLTEGPALVHGQRKSKIPSLSGPSLAPAQRIEWKKEVKVAEEVQFAQWRQLVGKMLKRIHVYRGRIQMRVLLGKFALTTFRRSLEEVGGIPFAEFVKVMEQPGTRGRMIKDLQEKESPEILLNYIYSGTKLFQPADVLTTKLDVINPVYTARFELNIHGTGKVQLEIEFSKLFGYYEITHSLWTRKTEKVEAIHPLEVFMIRPHGGISWEFQVSTFQALDRSRITPMMEAFAASVKLIPPPEGVKHEIWKKSSKAITWTRSMPVSSCVQKTALRYRIIDNHDWLFEFARYDELETSGVTTSWGATFWNSEWDRTLGKNSRLEIGNAAEWDPQLDRFFPRSRRTEGDSREAAGFRHFLRTTKAIAELLDGTKGDGI